MKRDEIDAGTEEIKGALRNLRTTCDRLPHHNLKELFGSGLGCVAYTFELISDLNHAN